LAGGADAPPVFASVQKVSLGKEFFMTTSKAGNKGLSIGLLVLGVAMMAYALVLDFSGSSAVYRGPLLVVGAIAILAGLYYFPTIEHHRAIINFIFLFPLLFTFVVTVIIPMVLGIGYSFTDWNGVKVNKVVGLDNYTTMFKDPAFIWSIVLTFLFVVVNIVLVNVIGFLLALLCSSKVKGVDFYRAAYFLPNLIGGIVLGYIWQFIFSNVLIKLTASAFGMRNSLLSNSKTAFIAIIIVYIWQYAGYIMLIYITGLSTVPKDVLEASAIDGASALTTLFRIKIPMIASTITICTFLTLTSAFKQFDVNMALTNGTGSMKFLGKTLSNGTQMLALNIYNTAISKNNYALGQAKAVLFFIILACVSIVQVRISNSKEVEL
jgi:raffinose/stachyose/melibiose transport system permease protein